MPKRFPWIYCLGSLAFGAGFCFTIGLAYAFEVTELLEKENTQKKQLIEKRTSLQIPIELKLIADRQYDLNEKIFIAEGNVQANLKGAILKADRIQFNRLEKTLLATGDLNLLKGAQYFQATSILYDFKNESGVLKDVYGVIDIKSLSNDISLITSEQELINNKKEISLRPINKITLNGGYQIQAGNVNSDFEIISKKKLNKSINSWRIKSDEINVTADGWSTKEITFTNDPFNPAQTKINAKNVKAEKGPNNSTLISIERSRLIVEDRISIPYRRNSKFEFGKGNKLGWNVGLDFKDRDGLFIGRELSPIELVKDLYLSLEPQFFIQRGIRGKTNNYIAPGSPVLSGDVESEAKISDLFGLQSELNGSKYGWDINLSANISTFNKQRFSNGYRFLGSLSKTLEINKNNRLKASIFNAYRNKAWNGTLGESEINYATGAYLHNEAEVNSLSSSHEYAIRIGTGNYEAEEYGREKLINLSKQTIFTSFKSSYPVWSPKDYSEKFSYRYSPEPISPGLKINTEFKPSYAIYSNQFSQALINFKVGPEFTFGSLNNYYLDFTRISIMPGITIKDGSSPFKFDNEVDLRTIKFELDQQIVGPLLFASTFEFNVDKDSHNYGKSLNSQTALIIHRRSYEFGIFYQPYQEVGGIMFRLNGFSFDNTSSPFKVDKSSKI